MVVVEMDLTSQADEFYPMYVGPKTLNKKAVNFACNMLYNWAKGNVPLRKSELDQLYKYGVETLISPDAEYAQRKSFLNKTPNGRKIRQILSKELCKNWCMKRPMTTTTSSPVISKPLSPRPKKKKTDPEDEFYETPKEKVHPSREKEKGANPPKKYTIAQFPEETKDAEYYRDREAYLHPHPPYFLDDEEDIIYPEEEEEAYYWESDSGEEEEEDFQPPPPRARPRPYPRPRPRTQ